MQMAVVDDQEAEDPYFAVRNASGEEDCGDSLHSVSRYFRLQRR